MAEGLGLAASIAAVLQITGSVISVCHDYSSDARGASSVGGAQYQDWTGETARGPSNSRTACRTGIIWEFV